ncbi:MAG: lipopolysaccharide heptosyltransferase II [Proteobacteria bacterium]|nr:lipopolysaccharide heptosyltransferase II [Pseudomonadota bacterium]
MHCPNWVGDLVMATPLLRTVRENNPDSHIAVMVRPQIQAVIEGLPYYDEIIAYDSKVLDRSLKRKWQVSRKLKKTKFALSIILPNSFSSAALSFVARIPHRAGYRTDGRGFLLTDTIPPPKENGRVVPLPMVDRYLTLCSHLNYSISSRKTVLQFSPGTREKVNNFYQQWGTKEHKPIVSIIPGASFGSSKCWPPENFAQVGDALIERYGAQIVIMPGPGEEDIDRNIRSSMRHRPFNRVAEIISLEHIKAIISDSALLVTNDTGPRHYAVAFDTPVVVIMGPTDPRYTNYDMGKTRLLRKDLECSPCHLKVCPTDHSCMKDISADRVLQACEEFLE